MSIKRERRKSRLRRGRLLDRAVVWRFAKPRAKLEWDPELGYAQRVAKIYRTLSEQRPTETGSDGERQDKK